MGVMKNLSFIKKALLLVLAVCIFAGCGGSSGSSVSGSYLDQAPIEGQQEIKATYFFPAGYVSDGSIGYMTQLQMALRYAARWNLKVVFPSMTYLIDNEQGLEVYSGLTIDMHGAVLKTASSFAKDGQVFRGQDIENVTFISGEIAGARDQWAESTNIAGIKILGRSANITIRDMYIHHISSNAVRIHGIDSNNPARNITISNVHADHCCNIYVDYLEPNLGPWPGTDLEDQGNIALYYVEDFKVDRCLLENSKADGTHFYKCNRGRFTNNILYNNHMGGYFIDGCCYVDADNNTITASGSRGVSIEGGSDNCTLTNNAVSNSGREGLWLIASSHWRITGNTFANNGRKNDAMVDCNINIDNNMGTFSREVQCQDVLIEANTLVTSAFQSWAIRISSTSKDIRIQHNDLKGENKAIRADAWLSGIGTVSVIANNGWRTESNGTMEFTGDGKTKLFTIKHGLDFSDPSDIRMLNYIKIEPTFLVIGLSPDFTLNYTYDLQNLKINFSKPPPAGMVFQVDWTAAIQQKVSYYY